MDALRPARLLAGGFGCGRVPYAPGTVASAVAVALAWGPMAEVRWALPLAAMVASVGGLWAIRAARIEGDPGWVVIDEIAGQWVALLALTRPTWPGLAAAFAVFRLLDVAKPGPIGWADRQGGAAGMMADDLIAGGFAAGIVWAARSCLPGVFG